MRVSSVRLSTIVKTVAFGGISVYMMATVLGKYFEPIPSQAEVCVKIGLPSTCTREEEYRLRNVVARIERIDNRIRTLNSRRRDNVDRGLRYSTNLNSLKKVEYVNNLPHLDRDLLEQIEYLKHESDKLHRQYKSLRNI